MARPRHKKTPELAKQAETLSGLGVTQDQIARILGISERTLQNYYAEELKQGIAKMGAQIAGWAVNSARKGNVTMQIFLCKTRLGWREVDRAPENIKPIKRVWVRGETRSSKLPKADDDEKNGTE